MHQTQDQTPATVLQRLAVDPTLWGEVAIGLVVWLTLSLFLGRALQLPEGVIYTPAVRREVRQLQQAGTELEALQDHLLRLERLWTQPAGSAMAAATLFTDVYGRFDDCALLTAEACRYVVAAAQVSYLASVSPDPYAPQAVAQAFQQARLALAHVALLLTEAPLRPPVGTRAANGHSIYTQMMAGLQPAALTGPPAPPLPAGAPSPLPATMSPERAQALLEAIWAAQTARQP